MRVVVVVKQRWQRRRTATKAVGKYVAGFHYSFEVSTAELLLQAAKGRGGEQNEIFDLTLLRHL